MRIIFKNILYEEHINKHGGLYEELNLKVQ
jgi:hypothetical protein